MSVNEVKLKKAKTEFEVRGTGDPSSRTFAIGDEDHTLGNALRHVLIQNSRIGFAGYSVPHPSEPVVHIRVQTITTKTKKTEEKTTESESDEDGEGEENKNSEMKQLTALDALKESAITLQNVCDFLFEEVEKCIPAVREDRLAVEEYIRANEYMEEEDEAEEMEEGGEDMETDQYGGEEY